MEISIGNLYFTVKKIKIKWNSQNIFYITAVQFVVGKIFGMKYFMITKATFIWIHLYYILKWLFLIYFKM